MQLELATHPRGYLGLLSGIQKTVVVKPYSRARCPSLPFRVWRKYASGFSADFVVPLCHAMLYHPDPGDEKPWVWREPRINLLCSSSEVSANNPEQSCRLGRGLPVRCSSFTFTTTLTCTGWSFWVFPMPSTVVTATWCKEQMGAKQALTEK